MSLLRISFVKCWLKPVAIRRRKPRESRAKVHKPPQTAPICKLPRPISAMDRRPASASPGGAREDVSGFYRGVAHLPLNRWTLDGVWNIARELAELSDKTGSISFRFHARDLHLVMGSPTACRYAFASRSMVLPLGRITAPTPTLTAGGPLWIRGSTNWSVSRPASSIAHSRSSSQEPACAHMFLRLDDIRALETLSFVVPFCFRSRAWP